MSGTYLKKRDIELQSRQSDTHKGMNGRCLIIGGSETFAGAPGLAGMAALRSGCDLVRIAAPENVAWSLNAYSPDFITIKIPGRELSSSYIRRIREHVHEADAVLLGNGLGKKERFIRRCVEEIMIAGKPFVLDADAIGTLPLHSVDNCILTPHADELKRLAATSGISTATKELQGGMHEDTVLLLKGAVDTILTTEKMYRNRTGNPAMAKAGTGDVLAGMCAAFLAQGYSLESSSINAAYLTGYFGDKAFREKGNSLTATDIIEHIRV